MDPILTAHSLRVYYGRSLAVKDISLEIVPHSITAFIGSSGCGKSTILRCFNRLNDLIEGFRLDGSVRYYNQDLYGQDIDPVAVRRRIGMVFQKPNPLPKSIFNNVAYGARVNGYKGNLQELVEASLRQAALWDEVKDKLRTSAYALSGGQQQRLCIARTLATTPNVILMDEPCASLDPISTLKIEELMQELKSRYTIVIVTHNLQQAARVSDKTAFFNVQLTPTGQRYGYLVEYDQTDKLFADPAYPATRDYVSGKMG